MSSPYRPPFGPLQILYEDAHICVAAKPFGLLSVPGRGAEKADCMAVRTGALTVHRLDMETSGVMVFARTQAAQSALSKAFEAREVSKSYIACVAGDVAGEAGQVDLPLIRDWPNRPRQKVDHDTGKPSLTDWRVIARGQGETRLELTPHTGRSHQLRVHMAAIGHPILGDTLYADGAALAASPRLLLHAQSLGFAHPETRAPLAFTSPAPF